MHENRMIAETSVFDAVRRGYDGLKLSSNEEIIDYFASVEPDAILGHTNNIKGILFEQVYLDQLTEQGVSATIFDATNHPISDIALWDAGIIIDEIQLKATDSVAYINSALVQNPDVSIIATSEVAASFDPGLVVDSGVSNEALGDAVTTSLFDEAVNPFSALSILRFLIGIPF